MAESTADLHIQLQHTHNVYFLSKISIFEQRRSARSLTDEIGDEAAVGEPAGGKLEVSEAVGPEVGLVKRGGVDVIVVSCV